MHLRQVFLPRSPIHDTCAKSTLSFGTGSKASISSTEVAWSKRGEHGQDVRIRFDAVGLCGLDETVEIAIGVGAGDCVAKEPVFAAKRAMSSPGLPGILTLGCPQMKRERFSVEQIINILRSHEAGVPLADLAREHGFAEGTIYCWKARRGREKGVARPRFLGLLRSRLSREGLIQQLN